MEARKAESRVTMITITSTSTKDFKSMPANQSHLQIPWTSLCQNTDLSRNLFQSIFQLPQQSPLMILVASSWFIDDWKSIWWIDWDNIYHSVLLIRKILQQIFHGWISCPVYYAYQSSHSTYQCSSFYSESYRSFSLEPCKRNSLSFPSHYIASTPSQYYHSYQKPSSEQEPGRPNPTRAPDYRWQYDTTLELI